MKTSAESTGIFTALSKAQGAIEAAKKEAENPAFKKDGKVSKYADLEAVIEVIQKPASENGLSVIFNYRSDDAGDWIKYILCHSGGERLEGEWVLMYMNKNIHGFGAANTYYRRQLLKGIYQIPETDDDGNSQSTATKPEPQRVAKKDEYPDLKLLKNIMHGFAELGVTRSQILSRYKRIDEADLVLKEAEELIKIGKELRERKAVIADYFVVAK